MNKIDFLELAIQLATDAHSGAVDKAGQPYIQHPIRVMKAVSGDLAKQVAVLHDTIEDTDLSLEDLRQHGFALEVVEAIDALSRREGEDYFDFIRRVKLNPLATYVKLADLEDNMDLSRLPYMSDRDLERNKRYVKASKILQESNLL